MGSGINADATLTKVGSNIQFLKNWTAGNEATFQRVMEILAEENPQKWAELFLRVQDKIAPPKETKNTISVHVDNDLQKLQALAGTIDSAKRIEPESSKTEFAKYEEL